MSNVTNNQAEQQYEVAAGAEPAVAAYRMEGNTISFTHTIVPEELEGQGIATKLISGALADVRKRGLKVVPLCSFVQHHIETHREEQDLLA